MILNHLQVNWFEYCDIVRLTIFFNLKSDNNVWTFQK